ncbi:MAG: DUF6968 family protein [Terriglobales bacterium]
MSEVSEVFAERRLRLRLSDAIRAIAVQLGPVVRKDGGAFCCYALTGFDRAISREIWGLDDVQAIQLAFVSIGADLDRLGGDGRYSVEGDSDGEVGHGFPPLGQ